ncbi:zinc dependent phospholipase C family protein [Desulfofundulus australicus]|jgi:phospholipase C|uniref:zinc dependent phospholipase C family protein n=1 Tax=Desulfofundulus australicus TaxID=1566 RepID=UPI00093475F1|nr:zinc dependent phospholipase C family protein [Desulfofundulus australicus]
MKVHVARWAHPVAAASRYLSSLHLPLQVLGASDTHVFCNEQGRIILYHDGYRDCARLIGRFATQLDAGVTWADRGLRSTTHHFDPRRGVGVWAWGNAAQKCRQYFDRALFFWHRGKYRKALFMLGAAVHLVQDACVPHHACCQLFDGHLDYEKWVKGRKHYYRVNSGGLYHLGHTPEEWVAANAWVAREYYPLVRASSGEESYHEATGVLLPRAQRSTAGFLLFFYRHIQKG